MYVEEEDLNWFEQNMKDDLAKVDELLDMTRDLKERTCSYSGLLSTREYINSDNNE